MDTHARSIRELTWNKCTVYGSMVQIRDFTVQTGIPISREQYYNLKSAFTSAKKNIGRMGQ
jgi:hypothetical protein